MKRFMLVYVGLALMYGGCGSSADRLEDEESGTHPAGSDDGSTPAATPTQVPQGDLHDTSTPAATPTPAQQGDLHDTSMPAATPAPVQQGDYYYTFSYVDTKYPGGEALLHVSSESAAASLWTRSWSLETVFSTEDLEALRGYLSVLPASSNGSSYEGDAQFTYGALFTFDPNTNGYTAWWQEGSSAPTAFKDLQAFSFDLLARYFTVPGEAAYLYHYTRSGGYEGDTEVVVVDATWGLIADGTMTAKTVDPGDVSQLWTLLQQIDYWEQESGTVGGCCDMVYISTSAADWEHANEVEWTVGQEDFDPRLYSLEAESEALATKYFGTP